MLSNVIPTPGLPPATAIVRNLLASHGPLHTVQLYQLGLERYPSRSVIDPTSATSSSGPGGGTIGLGEDGVARRPDGQPRFVKVGNKRGGSRLFVPMPEAPHPDHPFMSVNHMKHHILHDLESQSLIRKIRVRVPITDPTSPEGLEAIAKANKINRRRQRAAGMELPTVGSHFRKRGDKYRDWEEKVYSLEVEEVEPVMERTEFVWELVGPAELEDAAGSGSSSKTAAEPKPPIPPRTAQEVHSMSSQTSPHSSIIHHPLVASRWKIADSKSDASRRYMQLNIDRALERKAMRQEGHKSEREWGKVSRGGPSSLGTHRDGGNVEAVREGWDRSRKFAGLERAKRQREEERTAAQERFASLRPRSLSSGNAEWTRAWTGPRIGSQSQGQGARGEHRT